MTARWIVAPFLTFDTQFVVGKIDDTDTFQTLRDQNQRAIVMNRENAEFVRDQLNNSEAACPA